MPEIVDLAKTRYNNYIDLGIDLGISLSTCMRRSVSLLPRTSPLKVTESASSKLAEGARASWRSHRFDHTQLPRTRD